MYKKHQYLDNSAYSTTALSLKRIQFYLNEGLDELSFKNRRNLYQGQLSSENPIIWNAIWAFQTIKLCVA